MDVKVVWHNKLSFTGSADSGVDVRLGTPLGGSSESKGLSPMELVAIALASCTAMDVISIMRKKRQKVTAFEVEVHTESASEHPKVFTQAVIDYHVTGPTIDETALVRSIELSATRYCPVQTMLSKAFPIRLQYHIYEDVEESKPSLVKSGEYTYSI